MYKNLVKGIMLFVLSLLIVSGATTIKAAAATIYPSGVTLDSFKYDNWPLTVKQTYKQYPFYFMYYDKSINMPTMLLFDKQVNIDVGYWTGTHILHVEAVASSYVMFWFQNGVWGQAGGIRSVDTTNGYTLFSMSSVNLNDLVYAHNIGIHNSYSSWDNYMKSNCTDSTYKDNCTFLYKPYPTRIGPDNDRYNDGMSGQNPWVFMRFEYTANSILLSAHWSLVDQNVYESLNRRAFYLDSGGFPVLLSSSVETVKLSQFEDKIFKKETIYKTSFNSGVKFPVLFSLFDSDVNNRTYVFKDKVSCQKYLTDGTVDTTKLAYQTPDFTPDDHGKNTYFSNMPKRSDYDWGIIGDVEYYIDLVLFFIGMPFGILATLFDFIGDFINKSTAWFGDSTTGVIGFFTRLFSFLPLQVNVAIGGLVSLFVVFSIFKMMRK